MKKEKYINIVTFIDKFRLLRIVIPLIFILLVFPVQILHADDIQSHEMNPRYTVSFEGVEDRGLLKLLQEISNTVALIEKPPASIALLERRVEHDIPRISSALRSKAYYASQIDYSLYKDSRPIKILFRINMGPVFALRSIDAEITGEARSLKQELLNETEIRSLLGSAADNKEIIEKQDFIKSWLRNRGFPFVSINKPRVIVDHSDNAVAVTYMVESGVKARFGDVFFEGLVKVNQPFVEKRIPWKRGDTFSGELILKARENLNNTSLFATVNITEGEILDDKGTLPIYIRLKERKRRTLKAGVSFKTDEGPGGRVSWANRNSFGNGELLEFSGIISSIGYSTEGLFNKPEFLRDDQGLNIDVKFAEDRPDAFTSRNFTSLIRVERALSKWNSIGVGTGFRMSEIEQFGEMKKFNLFSLPMNFERDTRDDLLDPSKGGFLDIKSTPYYGTFGTNLNFIKTETSYNRYIQIFDTPNFILAGRINLGIMQGASLENIPADLRFYAGGGGSIRGYAYQSAGPLQSGIPIGGRSLITMATELRSKVTDKVGLVFFADAGSVFESTLPDFGEKIFLGAGMGLRYFTPIGPLRFDLGIPVVNRREDYDDSFQIYLSLGQAF